jgi:hypothetical protein
MGRGQCSIFVLLSINGGRNFLIHFKLTSYLTHGRISRMGQAERPTCPECGAPLVLALPPDGKGKRTFQCFDCDRLDSAKNR